MGLAHRDGPGGRVLLRALAKSGIWDPFELNVADLSRRISINVFGAHGLALEGADNSMPQAGRSRARGAAIRLHCPRFSDLRPSRVVGRLPLALWGIAGVASLYWFLARLIDRRAGIYGAIVLCTMPLYFIQARTMLGDIVAMASISMSFAGLGIATFDRPERGLGRMLALR